jgi:hypothetical protein
MALGWVFFVPLGNFVGRHFKETYSKVLCCKLRLWLLVLIISNTVKKYFLSSFHPSSIESFFTSDARTDSAARSRCFRWGNILSPPGQN